MFFSASLFTICCEKFEEDFWFYLFSNPYAGSTLSWHAAVLMQSLLLWVQHPFFSCSKPSMASQLYRPILDPGSIPSLFWTDIWFVFMVRFVGIFQNPIKTMILLIKESSVPSLWKEIKKKLSVAISIIIIIIFYQNYILLYFFKKILTDMKLCWINRVMNLLCFAMLISFFKKTKTRFILDFISLVFYVNCMVKSSWLIMFLVDIT